MLLLRPIRKHDQDVDAAQIIRNTLPVSLEGEERGRYPPPLGRVCRCIGLTQPYAGESRVVVTVVRYARQTRIAMPQDGTEHSQAIRSWHDLSLYRCHTAPRRWWTASWKA
jgi:hypothetical protein